MSKFKISKVISCILFSYLILVSGCLSSSKLVVENDLFFFRDQSGLFVCAYSTDYNVIFNENHAKDSKDIAHYAINSIINEEMINFKLSEYAVDSKDIIEKKIAKKIKQSKTASNIRITKFKIVNLFVEDSIYEDLYKMHGVIKGIKPIKERNQTK